MTSNPSSMDQPNEGDLKHSMSLHDYMREIEPTDNLPQNDLQPVLLGLFGEVGSIMTIAKKRRREKEVYAGYRQAMEEEFGDTLWYFTTLCRRLGIGVDTILSEVANQDGYIKRIAASNLLDGPVAHVSSVSALSTPNKTLLNLGEATAALLGIKNLDEQTHDLLRTFSDRYLQALQAANVSFSKIAHMNIEKTRGRFIDPDTSNLPMFDSDFRTRNGFPRNFKSKSRRGKAGKFICNGMGYLSVIRSRITSSIRMAIGSMTCCIYRMPPSFTGLLPFGL